MSPQYMLCISHYSILIFWELIWLSYKIILDRQLAIEYILYVEGKVSAAIYRCMDEICELALYLIPLLFAHTINTSCKLA
jgi:hypothetical protein